jgi:hypothetical protein
VAKIGYRLPQMQTSSRFPEVWMPMRGDFARHGLAEPQSSHFPEGWMSMRLSPPVSCESYEVKLADDSVLRAFWSGKAWWYQGKVVVPVSWRMPKVAAA